MVKRKLPSGQLNRNLKTLNNISKVIQKLDKKRSIRVGILQNKPVVGTDLSMADLGAIHEFGATIEVTEKMRKYLASQGLYLRKETTHIIIPTRSFLRMPLLSSEGKKALQVWSINEKEAFIEYFNKDTITADVLATTLGQKALERVREAFATSGFGNWKDITEYTKKHRIGSPDNPPLDSTGDLIESITFEVKTV